MQNENLSGIWHQVSVYIPELVYGPNLGLLFDYLIDRLTFDSTMVVLFDVDGAGDPTRGITNLGCTSLNYADFRRRLEFTEQLDWATFYFFEFMDKDLLEKICERFSIKDSISKSIMAVRAIDDTYIDVFTQRIDIANDLVNKYGPKTDLRSTTLDKMAFPL